MVTVTIHGSYPSLAGYIRMIITLLKVTWLLVTGLHGKTTKDNFADLAHDILTNG